MRAGNKRAMGMLKTLDGAQKRARPTAVAVATFKKLSEDHTTNMAAMVAFWSFFSIFPLLLVFVTLLGWFLPTGQKDEALVRVAEMFPLLDTKTVTSLSGEWWPVVLGAVTALWSGMGAVRTLQFAFNSIWEIPYHRRPGTIAQALRSLRVLATVGLGLVFTTLLSGFITSSSTGIGLGLAGRIGGYVFAIVFDVGLFIASFRMLTERRVSIRDVLPGALLSGIAFFVLQELSAFIISRHLKNAQATYGHFATVITILWWFYLQAVLTLLGAQLNVVLKDRLFPRSLTEAPQTPADHRVLQAYAAERAYQPEEQVIAHVERGRDRPLARAPRQPLRRE